MMLKLLCLLPFLAVASNSFGAKFLEDNRGKDGVISLPSGLQYKVLRAGTGSDHPTADSPCSCHYEGRTAENYPHGQKFDSSYDRGQPTTFAPNQVIKGWTIAMQQMVEGDKWEMYIPSDLAYGDGGRPPKIPGGAVLVFTMEIIKIQGKRIPAKKAATVTVQPTQLKANSASPLRVVFNVANLVGEPSEGSFTLEIHPDWAPLGAKRLQELVEAKFFDGVRFFRVIDNFMAQFGIHGDPSTMQKWKDNNIKDDAKVAGVGNKRGRVSFAMAGPNTRSSQFFINFKDNDMLDGMGFTPIAEVVEGMDVVDRIFKVGEGAPNGPGPSQGELQARGNAYLNEKFPNLSYVKSCRASGVPASKGTFLAKDTNQSGGSAGGKSNAVTNFSGASGVPATTGTFLAKDTNQSGGSAGGKSNANGDEWLKLQSQSSGVTSLSENAVQDFGDGLKLKVTQPGDGKTFPHVGDSLTMHYTLTLAADTSGKVIDSSRSRNQPFTFTIGQGEVIRGWDRGVMQMSLGQRGVLTVPAALGYGSSGAGGAIPPNVDLSFDVEVLGIGGYASVGFVGALGGVALMAVLILALVVVCRMSNGLDDTSVAKGIRRTLELAGKGIGKSASE